MYRNFAEENTYMYQTLSNYIMKRRPGARFHHVYIKGLENNIIFREREDFIAGMNYVAISTFSTCISMLAFTLMSNHFHFVVYGTAQEAKGFIDLYKNLIGRYVRNKYGTEQLLRRVSTGCKTIEQSNDALKSIIAYVLRNHIKAGINVSVQGYEWSSGHCYFAGRNLLEGTRSLSEIGAREYRQIMRSKVRLSAGYRLNSSGYIEPASYVCYEFVENCYGRTQNFDYFIYKAGSSRSSEGPVDFSDDLVLAGLREILFKKYEAKCLEDIEASCHKDILLMLRRQFNCSPKQLARIMKMHLKEVLAVVSPGI